MLSRKIFILPSLARAVFSPPRELNICMWHVGRCGSTVLAELISDSGRFNWLGEYFEGRSVSVKNTGRDADTTWENRLRDLKNDLFCSGNLPFGIEFKLWHAVRLNKDIETVVRALQSLGFSRHVILERRNYLKVYLSGRVGIASGVYHTTQQQNVFTSNIEIDPEHALKEVIICEEFYKKIRELLPPDSLNICYEDHLFNDPTVGYKMFLEHFGIEHVDAETDLKKTNSRPARDLVTNWDEVVAKFSDTPYAWMVED